MRRILLIVILICIVIGLLLLYKWQKEEIVPKDSVYIKKKPARVTDHKAALVLGGGGARGIAHIGVIKALEKNDIPIDIVVGTSMGAVVASLYAAGMEADSIESLYRNALKDPLKFLDFEFFNGDAYGFISFKPFTKLFQNTIGNKNIEGLSLKFACVATDLDTGEAVVFKKGPLLEAISASSAVPGVFNPVNHNGHWLVDGGLVNILPADIAMQMGATKIIAVNVNHKLGHLEIESAYDVVKASLHVIMENTAEDNIDLVNILIKPEVTGISSYDFRAENLDMLISVGEEAAHEKIGEVRKLLTQKR